MRNYGQRNTHSFSKYSNRYPFNFICYCRCFRQNIHQSSLAADSLWIERNDELIIMTANLGNL